MLSACGIAERPPVSAVPVVVEPGLSNVRTLDAEPSEDLGRDVISNGAESCPRSGRAEDDPLKGGPTHCSELSPSEPPAFVRISRTPAASVSLFRSVCDGNVHAVTTAPFEFMDDVDGKILSRNLTLPASDETRWAPAGAHEIACLQMER
jgi:hypothetical protein